MSSITHSERHSRDLLHAMRQRVADTRSALQSVRNVFIENGCTEEQFATLCELSLDELRELIGTHEDYLKFKGLG